MIDVDAIRKQIDEATAYLRENAAVFTDEEEVTAEVLVESVNSAKELLAEVERRDRAFDAVITRVQAEIDRQGRMRNREHADWLRDILADLQKVGSKIALTRR